MSGFLPNEAFRCLPFQFESFLTWSQISDISRFVHSLVASTTARLPDYGDRIYRGGQERCRFWICQFTNSAEESRRIAESVNPGIERMAIPDFSHDPDFGRALKYAVAWNTIVAEVLSENAVFSVEHLLETEDELECSLLLASTLYYKQATQILWNFLDELILPIHFCNNPRAFSSWKSNRYLTPDISGERGLAHSLARRRIIPIRLAHEIENQYRILSFFARGSERTLLNRGVYSGRHEGRIFKLFEFHEWCSRFSQSVDLGIRLLRINIEQWDRFETARAATSHFCYVCHNDKDFGSENYWVGEDMRVRLRCRKCGNVLYIPESGTDAPA